MPQYSDSIPSKQNILWEIFMCILLEGVFVSYVDGYSYIINSPDHLSFIYG